MIDYDPELGGRPELEPAEIKLLAILWSVPEEPQLKDSGSSAVVTTKGRLAQLEALAGREAWGSESRLLTGIYISGGMKGGRLMGF